MHSNLLWTAFSTVVLVASTFVAAMVGFFRARPGSWPLRIALAASTFSCIGIVLLDLWAQRALSPARFAVGMVLTGVAYGLFWWATRAYRGRSRPSAAFAFDPPDQLVARGPYAFIRHPFYASYILAAAGGAVFMSAWWAWCLPMWLGVIYRYAARKEEATILNSRLGPRYDAYRRTTGRFLPRLGSARAPAATAEEERSQADANAATGDSGEGATAPLLSTTELAAFSLLSPLRSIAHVLGEWFLIGAAIALCEANWHPALYVATVVWLGARQHALGILMHEAAHYRLHPDKRWNDALAEVFTAWPIFVSVRSYRANHHAHHRHVNTARDPDLLAKQTEAWVFPRSAASLSLTLLRDVLGINTIDQFRMFRRISTSTASPPPIGVRLSRLGFYLLVIALLTWFGAWQAFLLYWAVPFLTWFKLVLRIRAMAEHFGTGSSECPTTTRTTLLGPFGRWFIASKNINYHLEHHLYPSVPFFRLPALHQRLMAMPAYAKAAHVTPGGYLAVLRECMAEAPVHAGARPGRVPAATD